MNSELIMVFLPAISWCLFALGGTKISEKTPGWKTWRRFILPAVFAATVFFITGVWWRAGLVALLAIGAYVLPYGERTPWGVKCAVGLGYGLLSLPLGISAWNAFTAVGFISLFALSNTKATANIFVWKICEGSFGALCGVQIAYVLMKLGLTWW